MNAVVDTNIFMDYAWERGKLKDFASKFFKESMQCKHYVYLVRAVQNELKEHGVFDKIDLLVLNKLRVKRKLIIIDPTKEQLELAKKVSAELNIPFADASIAILAKETNCVIVTRDKHFFQNLTQIVDCFKPEDLF